MRKRAREEQALEAIFKKECKMEKGYSLFIDGLPWEMTWDWLLHIFSGEGEVSNVYVSKKRRRFNDSRFGFVRYKKLEEVMRAARNMNRARVRGRKLIVSFAKYDKQGMFHS